ncbi:MAG: tRNA lysidine(34) synthetase TilS [Silicimonas sp.]|nr:tRNA lysidine(34) synthetase TilS [Silicimonas sp.]
MIEDLLNRLGPPPPGGQIGVAVSGGSDSLAMLTLMVEAGWPVAAASVDHGLRDGSRGEAEHVARHCASLGVAHDILTWDQPDLSGNLQDKARQARYRLLAGWALARGIGAVALAHTMDDQAETFLMRLARGAGVDGLSGMAARREDRGVTWIRPLLTTRRAELRAFLEDRGHSWIDDPSNADPRFDRVKARAALSHLEGLGVTPVEIARSMANLSHASQDLRARAAEIAGRICREGTGDLVFDRAAFRLLSPEMGHRILTKALMYIGAEPYPPRREALELAEEAVRKCTNHTLHGCLLLISNMTLRITREWNAVRDVTAASDAPWDHRWVLDGDHRKSLEIRALGEAVKDTPWRETGLPRQSLLASPAVWEGERLVAAPVAGFSQGWTARATNRGNFAEFLLRR